MFYVTGDIHGSLEDLACRIKINNITEKDVLIILGDAGFNFYLGKRDDWLKDSANSLGPTIFCIRGNHEARPSQISSYKMKTWMGAPVYYEESRPNLLFGIDGEVYDFDGHSVLVIGGAYSVDKYYRAFRNLSSCTLGFGTTNLQVLLDDIVYLAEGRSVPRERKRVVDNQLASLPYGRFGWFSDEQPSIRDKLQVKRRIRERGGQIDIVLSHTVPFEYQPTEVFLPGLNQKTVDNRTELWLQGIESELSYSHWYAGHYHTDKAVTDSFDILYRKVVPLF